MPCVVQLCYRKALLILPSRVIPCMINPLVLSDFLTDSYNLGACLLLLQLVLRSALTLAQAAWQACFRCRRCST